MGYQRFPVKVGMPSALSSLVMRLTPLPRTNSSKIRTTIGACSGFSSRRPVSGTYVYP